MCSWTKLPAPLTVTLVKLPYRIVPAPNDVRRSAELVTLVEVSAERVESYKKQFTPFTVTTDYYNSTVEVPGEFFNYIAHSVYADFLRVQNRQEQALAEEQVAQTYLALELEKIDIRSNNNTINKRFSTYVNRQAR